jgi:DNA-binding GntR family transcriptional regulator
MTIQDTRETRNGATSPLPLAAVAYEGVKMRLILLDIRPGDPINDGTLAAELGMGRTPVREALKRLETDHLVVAHPRRGTFATAVDVTELSAISDIRQLLEPHAARRAAEHATPQLRAELRKVAEGLRQPDLPEENQNALIRRDMAVHHLIYRASGNAHLQDVLTRYDNLATRIWCLVIDKLPDLADHIREHAPLLDAIADGDGDVAAELALTHITAFDQAIRRVL